MGDGSVSAGRLADKIAIVTGVGGKGNWYGTGRATAVLFAREGAKVVVVDIDDDALAASAQIIGDAGGEVAAVRADVSRSDDCERAVQVAVDHWGRLDVLVNNCGVTHAEAEHGRSVLDANEASWDRL